MRLRRDVKADFDGQIDLLERSYRQAMTELTDRERGRLLQYGRQILDPVFTRFASLVQDAEHALEAVSDLETQIRELRERLGQLE